MKKIINYMAGCIGILLIAACGKDSSLWNQDGKVSETQKGTILGQLINDDDNQPLKGVKILFERQTTAKGGQTFVDTVSTDTEGKFSYQIPFPNKVKLSIRDTGRYAKDEVFVEVLEHKEYNVTMNSHPRFGISSINPTLVDENQQPLEGLRLALFVRESNDEEYSLVETLVTGSDGKVLFENIAFPVNYKVELIENPIQYELVYKEGRLLTKDPLEAELETEVLFGASNVDFVSNATSSTIQITYTQLWDEEVKTINFNTDNNGHAVVQLPYPISGSISSLEYRGITLTDVKTFNIDKTSEKEITLEIKDRTSAKVSVSVLGAASGALYIGGKVNVYARELGSTNEADFSLFNTYTVDAQGYINITNIDWPKELKLVPNYADVTGNLGALDFATPSVKIEVKDFNEVEGAFGMPYPNGYMLLGNPSGSSTSARILYDDLGVYNDPAIFGNNTQSGNQELTFQIKVRLNAKGQYNPSIGGTVHTNSNNDASGNGEQGYGFMHSGHGGTPTWRFRFGQRLVTASGADAEMKLNEWTTLTAVVRNESGTRRVYLYTNGILNTMSTNTLGTGQTAVTTAGKNMVFGNGPGQYGAGSMTNYLKDFRIYTRALTAQEIAANACDDFLSPAQVSADPSLIGYWPMNDGYSGFFKNYSKDSRADGKDMVIGKDVPNNPGLKVISDITRKCD